MLTNRCACGCGRFVGKGDRYVLYHHNKTPEMRALLTAYNKSPIGRQRASEVGRRPETLARLAIYRDGKAVAAYSKSPEGRRMHSEVSSRPENIARLKSLKWRRMARKNGLKNGNTPENIARLRALANTPENKARLAALSRSPEARKRVHDRNSRPENIKNLLSAARPKPSNLENRVVALNYHYHLPYDYVGDGKLLIGEHKGKTLNGYKCPDFVHRTKKIVVEVADEGDKKREHYGKKGYASRQAYEKSRRDHFNYYGWKVLFLWSDMTDEEMVSILELKPLTKELRVKN